MAVSRTRGLLVLVAFTITSLATLTARAGENSYVYSRKYTWKPTFGIVNAQNTGSSCSTYCHYVDNLFEWTEWPSLTQVDYPRTPSQYGTYEHEIRFYNDTSPFNRWCDPGLGADNVVTQLPSGSYTDNITDSDEFTWGVRTWRLILNQLYEIYFECRPQASVFDPNAPTNNQFNLTGQLGHCHVANGCNGLNTYGDKSTILIPKIMGRAPEQEYWDGWFANNYSFDYGLGDLNNEWSVSNGTATRYCNTTAWHGSCYWRLNPASSTSRAYVSYVYFADPPTAGTASIYHEAVVRCNSAISTSNCSARLIIHGLDNSGNITLSIATPWDSVPRSTGWYALPFTATLSETGAWPAGTTKWQFYIQAYDGTKLEVDYNQQYFYLPH